MFVPGETIVPSGIVRSETKVRLFVQGGIGVGVAEIEAVGVSGIFVGSRAMGVVVERISVGTDLVGGRKSVGVDVGAQEAISHTETKMSADTTLENLLVSALI